MGGWAYRSVRVRLVMLVRLLIGCDELVVTFVSTIPPPTMSNDPLGSSVPEAPFLDTAPAECTNQCKHRAASR